MSDEKTVPEELSEDEIKALFKTVTTPLLGHNSLTILNIVFNINNNLLASCTTDKQRLTILMPLIQQIEHFLDTYDLNGAAAEVLAPDVMDTISTLLDLLQAQGATKQ